MTLTLLPPVAPDRVDVTESDELALYHYTCSHGKKGLDLTGMLYPAAQLVPDKVVPPQGQVSWMTDLAAPHPGLCLSQDFITCDRSEFRFRIIDTTDVKPWSQVAPLLGAIADELESAPAALPEHWYVSSRPVRVVYDPM